MSPRQLSARLKPFGVRPGPLRDGAKTGKGYALEQFADAFARYLPPPDPSHPTQLNADKDLREIPIRHKAAAVTDRESSANPYRTGVVSDVTDRGPDSGRGGEAQDRTEGDREVFDL
jgi:hypothetical protein